ncbi:hypothetical protein SOCE26_011330 [Sorangium cellulosum]|uniref:Secreted protein n=1 Tax=Sorangium cellulosum TaxID=56 RepID=A0A2L0EKE3_SORCE|nr:hypothetical protein [Sorangium cellulosum]AUX39738.1 hypothetical protein SOCE26_011330 [Sorangium cellulosum]
MNMRTSLLVMVAAAVGALSACNWTVGDCYPIEERSSGVGAGPGWDPVPVYSSSASGDFGAEPPEDPQDGSARKIQCNKSDTEEEEEEERPTESPTSPQDPCPGVVDTSGDGAIFLSCSDACSSKCPPGLGPFVNFEPSDFPFVTTIEDDGKDDAGGWQEANVKLKFERYYIPHSVKIWYCPFVIGMPIRAEFMGKIDPDLAASLSEEVTEYVGRRVDYKLPQGIFCERFIGAVQERFDFKYELLGAKVRKVR